MAAVTDFRIEVGFFEHRKTRRLIRSIGIEGAWALLRLWENVAMNAPTGHLKGWDSTDIEEAAKWDGKPGAFFAAITSDDSRFLDVLDAELYPHNWHKRQPWAVTAAAREEHARNAANKRHGNARSSAPSMPGAMPPACPEQCPVSDSDSDSDPSGKNPPTPLSGGGGDLGAEAPEEEPQAGPADTDRQERVRMALNAWNRVLAGTRLFLPPGAGIGEHCMAARDIPPEVACRAEEIAMAVRRSRKLREEATWCSFAWAMKPRNADKLLAGQWPPDAPIPVPRPDLDQAVAEREAANTEATQAWLESLSAEDRAIVNAGGIPRPRQPDETSEEVAEGIIALRTRLATAPLAS